MDRLNTSHGASLALYPQRAFEPEPGWLMRAGEALLGPASRAWRRQVAQAALIGRAPRARAPHDVPAPSPDELAHLRGALRRQGLTAALVLRCLRMLQPVCHQALGLRPFPTQVQSAWLMLRGMVVQMNTGEGKTLAAALAAATAALAGRRVHVITANDYLAERDAQTLAPLYRALGLRSAFALQSQDPQARQQAWQADVVHCTHQVVVFDYLRDRLAMKGRKHELQLAMMQSVQGARAWYLRGLDFAIVDEADNILVDEARTPLVISAEVEASTDVPDDATAATALSIAQSLQAELHYRIERLGSYSVRLLEPGRAALAEVSGSLGGPWALPMRREELVEQALAAWHLYRRDEHYLVREGKVQIIDAATGRVMPDRSWSAGLHQLVEVKEGCRTTAARRSLTQISFQQFFRRYLHLSGMTGTAREVRAELGRIYQLPVAAVASLHPSRRRIVARHACPDRAAMWRRVADRVLAWHARGNPVLVGTSTLADSEALAALLRERGVACTLLNARQDREEAATVSAAGQAGAITIATNMAGRGTDIRLGPGVEELGGLVVLLCGRLASARLERQLLGRCARFGDPGLAETFACLDDELFAALPRRLRRALAHPAGSGLLPWVLGACAPLLQAWQERRGARLRQRLLEEDCRLQRSLAFTGEME